MEQTGTKEQAGNFIIDGKIMRLDFNEITHIVLSYGQTVIYTTTGRYKTGYDLVEVQQRLPAGRFMRIDREFIVALAHIDRLEQYQVYIGRYRLQVNYFYRSRLLDALDTIDPKPFIDISRNA